VAVLPLLLFLAVEVLEQPCQTRCASAACSPVSHQLLEHDLDRLAVQAQAHQAVEKVAVNLQQALDVALPVG
jgi:hypothetical protein